MITNTEAERAFIGCYICDANVGRYEAKQHGIDCIDAYTDAMCVPVWTTIQRLESENVPISAVSVSSAIDENCKRYVPTLIEACVTTAHAGHYAEQVADCLNARRAIAAANALCDQLKTAHTSTSAIQAAMRELSSIGTVDSVPINRVGDFALPKLQQWSRAGAGDFAGVPFCIDGVNNILGGLRYGIASVFAAYRGTGKSTLVRQQAHFAASRDIPTLLISLEDPADACDACIAGRQSGVSVFHLDIGQSSDAHMLRMKQAWDDMRDLPLWIVDRNVGLDRLGAIVERMVRQHGIKLVVLDHIQYVRPIIMQGMNRTDTLAHYSGVVCGWARDFGLHAMVVSQLSNDAEKQGRARVRMSDIRGCGAIADDCRQACGLYGRDDGTHVLEILKNNFGMSNKAVALRRCDGEQRFEELPMR